VAPVNFRRDVNRNSKVDNEPVQSGMIGLNQHSGSDQAKVDHASYACLAAQSQSGHLHDFMPLVKSDPRYRRNRAFVFTTTTDMATTVDEDENSTELRDIDSRRQNLKALGIRKLRDFCRNREIKGYAAAYRQRGLDGLVEFLFAKQIYAHHVEQQFKHVE
jgi:hypothetical protein